jgi:hypothetical protein
MNATNRALNRAFILIVGLVLLGVGALVAAAAAIPAWLAAWQDGSDAVTSGLGAAIASAPIAGSEHSWILIAGAGVAVIVAVLLVVFVLRQGHGHTRTVLSREGDGGEIAVDASVVHSAIEQALRDHPGVGSVSVSSYRVRKSGAVKIAIGARRGASPADLREAADAVVARWDDLLGEELPVLITVGSAFAPFAKTRSITETPS